MYGRMSNDVSLKQFINTQTTLLESLAQKFKESIRNKADENNGVITGEFVEQEFKQLDSLIKSSKMEGLRFLQNPFEWLPRDILALLLSFLPSYAEMRTMACVCKSFNTVLSNSDNFLKLRCLDRLDNQ